MYIQNLIYFRVRYINEIFAKDDTEALDKA